MAINPEFCEMIHKYFITPTTEGGSYIPNEFRLPITKLEDIDVCIELYAYNYNSHINIELTFGIKIDCVGFRSSEDDDSCRRLWTKTDFKTIMDALLYFKNEFIPNFKIDNLNGRIIINKPNEENKSNLLLEFSELFSDNEKVKLLYDKCVICFEKTITTTGCCECSLCLTCANKLDFEMNDDVYGYKCPHCRETNDLLQG